MPRTLRCILALTLLSGVIVASCAQGSTATPPAAPSEKAPVRKAVAAWETDWNMTVEAAQKEGKLMIYATPSSTVLREIGAAFQRKYGIEVESIDARGEELANRMQMEKAAGLYLVDVVMSGGPTMLSTMKPLGLLGKLEPQLLLPEVVDPGAWVTDSVPYMDKDHTRISMVAAANRWILYNTETVKEGEIASYDDLLNPKWKGKMVINDPTVAGTGNAFLAFVAEAAYGLEDTGEYMRRLVKQEPVVTRDRRLQGEWVARGKYPLSVANNMETAIDFIRLGAPVTFARVKGDLYVGSGAAGVGVPAKMAHPNAAKVFVNWLLSREGHGTFIKVYGNPGARRDAPRENIPAALFPEPGEKIRMESEESQILREKIATLSGQIFAPLLK